jgi:pimeloyl-ACP methyl ester carboxylesterase
VIAYPPPGRLVDIGGRNLHVYEVGAGSPTVILESGLAASSLSWRIVQEEIAKFTRVISYDRAGLGWSDPAPAQPTLARLVSDLHGLLRTVPPPYILVAHSFGSAVVSAYSRRFGDNIRGLALVDPLRPEDWSPLPDDRRRMLARAVRLSRRGATLARLGVVGWCLRAFLAGARWLPRLVTAAAAGDGAALMGRLAGEVAKMPRELWPMVASNWSNPKAFLAMAEQLEALPGIAAELLAAPPLQIPVIVLTPPAGGGHWIQLDQPSVVIEAVRRLVQSTT